MESLLDTARLRTLIKRKYGTQEHFAKEAGVTRQYIGLILHGDRVPKLATLYRFAEVLGVKVDTLLMHSPRRAKQEQAPVEQMELA